MGSRGVSRSISDATRRGLAVAALLGISLTAGVVIVSPASAAEVVALGASNTHGRGKGRHPDGVDRPQAYPAQLQAMLARQGCKARVLNAGVPGDTTDGMLRRLPRLLAKDTRVLIVQAGRNDRRMGIDSTQDNLAAIEAYARARGVKVIMLDGLGRMARAYLLADGQHFSAEGHEIFARSVLPEVSAAACGR